MWKILILLSIFLIKPIYAENSYFIPKTFLILPQESIVRIKWLIPPDPKNKLQNFSANKFHFVIDYKDEPLVIYENKLILNPITGYILKLKEDIKNVICLDDGVLLFSDGVKMGYLEVEKNSEPFPIANIKLISKLPLQDAKLFKGERTVYASGYNIKTKEYEVYVFNPQKSLFQRVASFKEPINALSGREKHIFFSNGNVIKDYKEGKISIIYEHPRQNIEEIYYNEKAGLIYKTSNGVGIIRDKAALEFLQTENPIIFLKGTSLYVFFPSVSGVLEILNIEDLKNFGFKVQKIIDIQQTF